MAAPAMDLAALRAIVSRHFRVYDAQEERMRGQVIAHRFYIMFPQGEFDARFEAAQKDITAADKELLVFLRRDGGEDILFVAKRPEAKPQNIALRVAMLLATIATTTTAGALTWNSYWHGARSFTWSVLWDPQNLLWGFVTFALPLLLMLGIHETAHFVTARRHGLRATLPLFIPAPPGLMPIGTFGAFISLKDPLPDRKVLFDVGASGPLAGFLVAVPVVIIGALLTTSTALPIPDLDRPELSLDIPHELMGDPGTGFARVTATNVSAGTAIIQVTAAPDAPSHWPFLLRIKVTLANGTHVHEQETTRLGPGETALRSLTIPEGATAAVVELEWDDGLIGFGDPLLVHAINRILQPPAEYLTHPTFFAGWVGLLITGINLIPAGQLDGSHVARAVLGEQAKWAARLGLGLLIGLTLLFSTWLLMALFVIFTGIYHPPPLNDRTRLDRTRMVLAAVVLAVFVLTFVPVPFQV
jgi:membrane-associated protease RseP (regulator of RpoE activity)